jgi:hypothetical protein
MANHLKTIVLLLAISLVSAIAGLALFIAWDAMTNKYSVAVELFATRGSVYVADDELGFRYRPGAAQPTQGVYFDRLGARVSHPGDETLDPVDILAVGCSQAYGEGVTNDATFTSVTGQLTGLTTANFGISGQGGVGSLLMLRRMAYLKPKFIVYGLWFDHLNRNVLPCMNDTNGFCVERPYMSSTGGLAIRYPTDAVKALSRAQALISQTHPGFAADFMMSAARWWRVAELAISPDQTPEKATADQFVVSHMAQTAHDIGARLIVLWIPNYISGPPPPAAGAPPELVAMAQRDGFTLIDLTETFRAQMADGVGMAIPHNGHMTVAAHRIAGEMIARAIAASPSMAHR